MPESLPETTPVSILPNLLTVSLMSQVEYKQLGPDVQSVLVREAADIMLHPANWRDSDAMLRRAAAGRIGTMHSITRPTGDTRRDNRISAARAQVVDAQTDPLQTSVG